MNYSSGHGLLHPPYTMLKPVIGTVHRAAHLTFQHPLYPSTPYSPILAMERTVHWPMEQGCVLEVANCLLSNRNKLAEAQSL